MSTHRHEWTPLLTGAQRDRAWETVEAIASDLARLGIQSLEGRNEVADAYWGTPTLAGGDAGISLFLDACRESEFTHGELADGLLERAVSNIATITQPGLFTGLSGIALVVAEVADTHDAEGLLSSFDLRLVSLFREMSVVPNVEPGLDILEGIAGIGVYLLGRISNEAIIANGLLIDLLIQKCASTRKGVAWARMPFRPELEDPVTPLPNVPFVDLGIARGFPGILAVASALQRDKHRAPVAALMRTLQHCVETDTDGCALPLTIDGPSRSHPYSRLGWCAGDLGVATAMLAFGTLPESAREAWLSIARSCAQIVETDADIDAGLCHGTAGAAHLFARLYQMSGESVFAEAAQRWYLKTLDGATDVSGIGGYRFAWRPGDSSVITGVLRGSAGVGLSLLSAVTAVEPEWDRPFLSYPRRLTCPAEEDRC